MERLNAGRIANVEPRVTSLERVPPAPPSDTYGEIEHVSVNFDDLDPYGMVYAPRFLILFDRAFNRMLERLVPGFSPLDPAYMAVIREVTITYHAPFAGLGTARIQTWVDLVGRTSAQWSHRFWSNDGQIVHAEARRTLVHLDPVTRLPSPWTEADREGMTKLMRQSDSP
ncbi:acyl-CoA thioesterase [Actinoplanes sp. RD1]|uniref:acyl-CoA thioesterase n=1 Tax=Actinoplanes sp. RD1 TaxID=3064538 RepID=UPI0027427E1B|nr:acyl-CoA thioesterase [Actinoplanes sp. RD1]